MSVLDLDKKITPEWLSSNGWWKYSKTEERYVKNWDEKNLFLYMKQVSDGWEIYDSLNAPSQIINDQLEIELYQITLTKLYEHS